MQHHGEPISFSDIIWKDQNKIFQFSLSSSVSNADHTIENSEIEHQRRPEQDFIEIFEISLF